MIFVYVIIRVKPFSRFRFPNIAAIFQDGGFSWDGKVLENFGYPEGEDQNTVQKVSFCYYCFRGLSLTTLKIPYLVAAIFKTSTSGCRMILKHKLISHDLENPLKELPILKFGQV